MSPYQTITLSIAGRKPPKSVQENQDRILLRHMSIGGVPGLLVAVADGVSRTTCGGSVAHWVVEKHMKTDAIFSESAAPPYEQLQNYLRGLYDTFKTEFGTDELSLIRNSAASLSVVLFHGNSAHCLWAGDCPVYLSRRAKKGYETDMAISPDRNPRGELTDCFGAHAPFAIKHRMMPLQAGDVVTVASDGANIDSFGLSDIYRRHGVTRLATDMIAKYSTASQFHDDISLIAVQYTPD